jgi:hypothetical protein
MGKYKAVILLQMYFVTIPMLMCNILLVLHCSYCIALPSSLVHTDSISRNNRVFPSIIYCKVTVWLLAFNFIHFMAAFWAVFTLGGSGPALTAHGSFDLKQDIQI